MLLSGGLDSSTCLAYAVSKGYECYALSFDYGQRHKVEIHAAKRVARHLKAKMHHVVKFDLRKWGASALTSSAIKVPKSRRMPKRAEIPVTYVPARNIIFLSFAVSWAESIGATDIFIGVNSMDYSGYPDCRPEFIEAMLNCFNIGTRTADEGGQFKIHAPLQKMTKAEIVKLGHELGLDHSLTHSCYDPDEEGFACGSCDSCLIRIKGFREAGLSDPAVKHLPPRKTAKRK